VISYPLASAARAGIEENRVQEGEREREREREIYLPITSSVPNYEFWLVCKHDDIINGRGLDL